MAKEKEVRRVPNLRFPGFEGEWEVKKLGDVCEIKTGKQDTQNRVENGQYPFFVRSNTVERINSYSYDGEAILTSGDGVGVGKNFHYINGKFDFHQRVYSLRNFKSGYSGKYIYYLFSDKFYDRVIRLSAKNSVDSVRMDMISGMKIYFPEIIEQRKIESFLSLLDEKITTQIKIIEGLKLLKASASKKLLNNNDWKTYKVEEIGKLGRGRVISSKEMSIQSKPTYPVYSSQTSNFGIMGYLDTYDFDGEYITWTTDGANAGTVFYRKGKFNCTNVCGTIKLNVGFNPYFVAEYLQKETKKYVSSNLANPKLMNNVMNSIQLNLPDISIQNRIAQLLKKIDNKIELELTMYNFLIIQKQYLLSNLFI